MKEQEEAEFVFEINTGEISFVIDETLYPLDAIYGASYLFIDRCYVFLARPEDKKVTVRLRTRNEWDHGKLKALAGEFANELLSQVLRFRIGESTARIREYYMARAFVSTPARSSIDALLAELDAEELEDDDLEISVPWEQTE